MEPDWLANFGNDPFEGTFQNGQIEGTVKPNPGTTSFSHLESR